MAQTKKKTAKVARAKAVRVNAARKRRPMKQGALPGIDTEQPNMIARGVGGLDCTFLVRFTREEHAYVRKASFEAGRSASSFIRDAALVAIGEKLLAMAKGNDTTAAAKWMDQALVVQAGIA